MITTCSIPDMFMKDVQDQWDAAYKAMCVDPGDTMDYIEVRDRTDFGVLLHKEKLWSLYKFDEGRSLLYHLCRGRDGVPAGARLVNAPVHPDDGECSSCGSKSPDEIRGLWTLHNFDWIQKNGGGGVDV